MKDLIKPGKYRHYKGGLYDVLAIGKHTEREEVLVLYADSEKRIWCRPYAMFTEKVSFEEKEILRFEKID